MAVAVLSSSKRVPSAAKGLARGGSRQAARVGGSTFSFIGSVPRLSAATSRPPLIQTELKIGEPNDRFEQEADRAADQVLRGDFAGRLSVAAALPQRKCAACAAEENETLRREVDEAEEQRELRIGPDPGEMAEASAASVAQGGRPMSLLERAHFEPRFGCDFSAVRIHDEPGAHAAAQAIDARAFTLGTHVAFARGAYQPASTSGRRLLAHELAHVVQQGGVSSAVIRRENGAGGGGAATSSGPGRPPPSQQAAAPQPQPRQYGRACSGGADDPCQYARCDDRHASIQGDLSRAIGYVQQAIQALGATPLASGTTRALDWYFNDSSATTAGTVRARLICIRDCLQSSRASNNYGCDPDYGSALAYVCVGSTPICTGKVTPICLTNSHFGTSPRVRAQSVIHECAHRVGMSLGRPQSEDDIYRHTTRFLFLDTAQALLNSDSYALFAGAISEGVPVSIRITEPGLTGGLAFPGRGEATWHARLYLGTEVQHPVLGIFSPTLGIGFSFIGETTTGGPSPVTSPSSMLTSLLAGVRIADPRPGAAGGGYVSLFGGPSAALGSTSARLGAEAGVAVGYRWRWLDVSAGVGYAYDPTREAGMEHLLTLGASLSFVPFHPTIPGQ